jgi:hypothetical protein
MDVDKDDDEALKLFSNEMAVLFLNGKIILPVFCSSQHSEQLIQKKNWSAAIS